MDNWIIKDKIKSGKIKFQVDDEVIVYRRKKNGHPRGLKDGEVYIVTLVENDVLILSQPSSDGIGWLQRGKVHSSYLIKKSDFRDIKINELLDD